MQITYNTIEDTGKRDLITLNTPLTFLFYNETFKLFITYALFI